MSIFMEIAIRFRKSNVQHTENVLGQQPDLFLRLQELAESVKVTKCNFGDGSPQIVRAVAP